MLQIDGLDGSATFIEPKVNEVDVATITLKVLTSDGPFTVSQVDIKVCCHPLGKIKKYYFSFIQFSIEKLFSS